jgi:hypothetical protein
MLTPPNNTQSCENARLNGVGVVIIIGGLGA